MKRISSKWTYFSKKVVPVLFFCELFTFAGRQIWHGAASRTPSILLVYALTAALLAFITYFLVTEIADEVLDHGDHLVIKRGGQIEVIQLIDIASVEYASGYRLLALRLRLAAPGDFGESVTFIPQLPFTVNPFSRNPVAENLAMRVTRARTTVQS